MATATFPFPIPKEAAATLEDLVAALGGVPLSRILLHPAPGTATEQHVSEAVANSDRLVELVDGTLVEKAMGFRESVLAVFLAALVNEFVRSGNLGLVSGPDGTVRLFPGMVRIPDVAYASWARIPDRRIPQKPIPDLVPDLAVEILSESNTPAEMDRKRRDYFDAGVLLAWFIDPRDRTVSVFTSPDTSLVLRPGDTLDGGNVLPGFSLPLATLFGELDRVGQP
jgi:Uma2 family endonuclease